MMFIGKASNSVSYKWSTRNVKDSLRGKVYLYLPKPWLHYHREKKQ